jgi:hypothetical protein
MADTTGYTLDFAEIRMSDRARVGGAKMHLSENVRGKEAFIRAVLNCYAWHFRFFQ